MSIKIYNMIALYPITVITIYILYFSFSATFRILVILLRPVHIMLRTLRSLNGS
jgi:hypothetical protein